MCVCVCVCVFGNPENLEILNFEPMHICRQICINCLYVLMYVCWQMSMNVFLSISNWHQSAHMYICMDSQTCMSVCWGI